MNLKKFRFSAPYIVHVQTRTFQCNEDQTEVHDGMNKPRAS